MARNISTGSMGLAVLAIFSGLVGAYAVRGALRGREPPQRPTERTVPLASADLPAGRVIVMGDVALHPMTQEEMNRRNLPLELVMMSTEQIIGRRLREPIALGQPFLTGQFYLEGTGPNPEEMLEPGFRAFSLPVPEARGGWVSPDISVDVLFRAQPQRGQGSREAIPEATLTVVEGAKVLEVEHPEDDAAQTAAAARTNESIVTLAVTPRQANILQTIVGRGEITLVARPANETVANGTGLLEKLTLEDLLGIESPRPPEPPFETEIYRRTRRQLNRFERDRLTQQSFSGPPDTPAVPPVDTRNTSEPTRSTGDEAAEALKDGGGDPFDL